MITNAARCDAFSHQSPDQQLERGGWECLTKEMWYNYERGIRKRIEIGHLFDSVVNNLDTKLLSDD